MPSQAGLTPKQARVLKFIRESIEKNGFSPSYEEIGAALSMSSLATVSKHIENLKKRGHIDNMPRLGRSISIREG